MHSVALLEEAVEWIQARARQLAGVSRQHAASREMPTVIILIDEVAALTSYENERDLLGRANATIATLTCQDCAVGFIVAVAWCYSNGGVWIRRVETIVEQWGTRL